MSSYLGIILDSKLDFNIHVDNKIKKCYEIIGIIKVYLSVFREKLYLPSKNPSSHPSKNPSSCHIWTMEISYIINQKIKIFKIN